MAFVTHERPQSEIPGIRSASAPANNVHANENVKHTVLERTDNPEVAVTNDNSGVLLFATRAMSAPHPMLTSDNCQAASHPIQQDSTMQMATLKTEPGTSEVTTKAMPLAPDMESTASEAALKSEQNFNTFAATQFSHASPEITLKGLRDVAGSMNLAKLEAGVSAARDLLDQLHTPLQDFKQHEEIHDWLSLINNLKVKSQKAGRTVIAVAGGTGAGKSSLINAVLGEEKLLPTNGMRACTAVITEVSWNDVDDSQQAYRAEVEFVSPEEWGAELQLMYDELLDDNGQLILSWRDKATEAGVAYDKVQAVYPELTQDMVLKSKPQDLVQNPAIAACLGTTRKFAYSNAQALYSNLTKVIDSKEKVSAKEKKIMALWPIIRVVKIFVRAEALSTGVVLVDLPGTADSNAARSAVANKYMAECTSVWVVARITRAVDDKEAKNLLGRSSRIQMKLDGAYSHLTFVATQTDGIDVQETIDAVDSDGQIQATYAREQQLSNMIEEEKHRSRGLDKQLDDLSDEYDALQSEIKTWRDLQKKQKKGQQVYAPTAPPKRSNPTKRRRGARRPIVDDNSDSDSGSDRTALSQDEISAKIQELNAAFDVKASECDSAEKQGASANANLESLEQQKTDIAGKRFSLCVEKRNNYCRVRNHYSSIKILC